jgi:hypothetical protein
MKGNTNGYDDAHLSLVALQLRSQGYAPMSSPEEALAIAQEAYTYLYPLVLMDLTRRQMINGDPKTNPAAGPPNTFVHLRAYPPPAPMP